MSFSRIAAIGAAVLLSGTSLAGDAPARAAVCASCHGMNGVSSNPLWPNLAGQKEAYLAKAIRDYRDGARQDPTMTPMAAGITDEEIAALAAYYASLPAGG